MDNDQDFDLFDLGRGLGCNASVPYSTIRSSGPPSRPLEFPAPTVDHAETVSADIVDHRTGVPFRATSVLMRRTVHARTCRARAVPPVAAGGLHNGAGTFDAATSRSFERLRRKATSGRSPDMIHSWHSAFNAPSSSIAPLGAESSDAPTTGQQQQQRHQHRRVHSHSPETMPSCGPSCYLPDKAYCVLKKICNTTYGSLRLCVVLKRVRSRSEPGDGRLIGGNAASSIVPAWTTTNEMVAIKVVNWNRLQSLRGRHLEDPIREVAALQQLLGNYHPNVISLLDALQDETRLFAVFPYVAGGDLCGCLLDNMASSPTGRLDESLARTWFRQILSAVNHLQKKGVCHRDICLENMVVDGDGKTVRIVDFGVCLRVPFADPNQRNLATDASANTLRRLVTAQGQCGRLEYMAPEVLARHDRFDGFAVDLWAAGIVLFELLVGKKPFGMPDPADGNFRAICVEGGLAALLRERGIGVTDDATDLLQNMLWCDPDRRLTLSEIVNHRWVEGRSRAATPADEDGTSCGWFIRNRSIDDADSLDSPLTRLVDESYSRSSTVESLASTVSTSDAESQNPSSQLSSSDHPIPCETTLEHSSPLPTPRGDVVETGTIHAQRKRNWSTFHWKWRRSEKAASVQ